MKFRYWIVRERREREREKEREREREREKILMFTLFYFTLR